MIAKTSQNTYDLERDISVNVFMEFGEGKFPGAFQYPDGRPRKMLALLNACDSNGNFNPGENAPYRDVIESGTYAGWQKIAYDSYRNSEIVRTSVQSIGFGLDSLTFQEWIEMGKPTKVKEKIKV